jgi:thioredoxin
MKIARFFTILSIIVLLTACTQQSQSVNPQKFAEGIENNDVTVLDVRTPEEYKMKHIEDAVNIDIYRNDFESAISGLDKSKPVYVYCKSGGRSGDASAILQREGFEVYNLEGGLMAWENQNLELVKNTIKKEPAMHYSLAEYNSIVDSNELVLFDFMADWCGPCKAMAPGLHNIETELGDKLTVLKVNVDFNPELSQHFKVASIPTLKLYSKGELVEDIVGGRSEAQLREMLQPYL